MEGLEHGQQGQGGGRRLQVSCLGQERVSGQVGNEGGTPGQREMKRKMGKLGQEQGVVWAHF